MSKVYTRFQSKKRKNPTPLWWHIPFGLHLTIIPRARMGIGWEFLPGENLIMLNILSEDLGAL